MEAGSEDVIGAEEEGPRTLVFSTPARRRKAAGLGVVSDTHPWLVEYLKDLAERLPDIKLPVKAIQLGFVTIEQLKQVIRQLPEDEVHAFNEYADEPLQLAAGTADIKKDESTAMLDAYMQKLKRKSTTQGEGDGDAAAASPGARRQWQKPRTQQEAAPAYLFVLEEHARRMSAATTIQRRWRAWRCYCQEHGRPLQALRWDLRRVQVDLRNAYQAASGGGGHSPARRSITNHELKAKYQMLQMAEAIFGRLLQRQKHHPPGSQEAAASLNDMRSDLKQLCDMIQNATNMINEAGQADAASAAGSAGPPSPGLARVASQRHRASDSNLTFSPSKGSMPRAGSSGNIDDPANGNGSPAATPYRASYSGLEHLRTPDCKRRMSFHEEAGADAAEGAASAGSSKPPTRSRLGLSSRPQSRRASMTADAPSSSDSDEADGAAGLQGNARQSQQVAGPGDASGGRALVLDDSMSPMEKAKRVAAGMLTFLGPTLKARVSDRVADDGAAAADGASPDACGNGDGSSAACEANEEDKALKSMENAAAVKAEAKQLLRDLVFDKPHGHSLALLDRVSNSTTRQELERNVRHEVTRLHKAAAAEEEPPELSPTASKPGLASKPSLATKPSAVKPRTPPAPATRASAATAAAAKDAAALTQHPEHSQAHLAASDPPQLMLPLPCMPQQQCLPSAGGAPAGSAVNPSADGGAHAAEGGGLQAGPSGGPSHAAQALSPKLSGTASSGMLCITGSQLQTRTSYTLALPLSLAQQAAASASGGPNMQPALPAVQSDLPVQLQAQQQHQQQLRQQEHAHRVLAHDQLQATSPEPPALLLLEQAARGARQASLQSTLQQQQQQQQQPAPDTQAQEGQPLPAQQTTPAQAAACEAAPAVQQACLGNASAAMLLPFPLPPPFLQAAAPPPHRAQQQRPPRHESERLRPLMLDAAPHEAATLQGLGGPPAEADVQPAGAPAHLAMQRPPRLESERLRPLLLDAAPQYAATLQACLQSLGAPPAGVDVLGANSSTSMSMASRSGAGPDRAAGRNATRPHPPPAQVQVPEPAELQQAMCISPAFGAPTTDTLPSHLRSSTQSLPASHRRSANGLSPPLALAASVFSKPAITGRLTVLRVAGRQMSHSMSGGFDSVPGHPSLQGLQASNASGLQTCSLNGAASEYAPEPLSDDELEGASSGVRVGRARSTLFTRAMKNQRAGAADASAPGICSSPDPSSTAQAPTALPPITRRSQGGGGPLASGPHLLLPLSAMLTGLPVPADSSAARAAVVAMRASYSEAGSILQETASSNGAATAASAPGLSVKPSEDAAGGAVQSVDVGSPKHGASLGSPAEQASPKRAGPGTSSPARQGTHSPARLSATSLLPSPPGSSRPSRQHGAVLAEPAPGSLPLASSQAAAGGPASVLATEGWPGGVKAAARADLPVTLPGQQGQTLFMAGVLPAAGPVPACSSADAAPWSLPKLLPASGSAGAPALAPEAQAIRSDRPPGKHDFNKTLRRTHAASAADDS